MILENNNNLNLFFHICDLYKKQDRQNYLYILHQRYY